MVPTNWAVKSVFGIATARVQGEQNDKGEYEKQGPSVHVSREVAPATNLRLRPAHVRWRVRGVQEQEDTAAAPCVVVGPDRHSSDRAGGPSLTRQTAGNRYSQLDGTTVRTGFQPGPHSYRCESRRVRRCG